MTARPVPDTVTKLQKKMRTTLEKSEAREAALQAKLRRARQQQEKTSDALRKLSADVARGAARVALRVEQTGEHHHSVTAKVTRQMLAAVDDVAFEAGITRSEWFRRACAAHLSGQKTRSPMSELHPLSTVALIPETPGRDGRRLGRHHKVDPRSLADHSVKAHMEATGRAAVLTAPLVSRVWKRTLKPLNQGALGACCGNAIAGLLVTEPNNHDGVADDIHVTETLAKQIYSLATKIDNIHGEWPSDDTGSTGLDALRAAKQLGLIAGYKSCANAAEVLQVLSHVGPVAVGTAWLVDMDDPDETTGLLTVSGKVDGGHEYAVVGINVENQTVEMINSWGSWGLKGRAHIGWADFARLIDKMHGDAVLILPPVKPV